MTSLKANLKSEVVSAGLLKIRTWLATCARASADCRFSAPLTLDFWLKTIDL